MLLGLQPARYVVHPHYEDKLRKLLDVTCDMEGGLPLEYDITSLKVPGKQHYRIRQRGHLAQQCTSGLL